GVAISDSAMPTAVESFGSADTRPALVRYLLAGRAYRLSKPGPVEVTSGAIGALWQLRQITAALNANHGADAVTQLVAMGDHALGLRMIAAAAITNHWELTPADIGRAWDAVAVGPYRNVARAQAIQALANRGAIDAAV